MLIIVVTWRGTDADYAKAQAFYLDSSTINATA